MKWTIGAKLTTGFSVALTLLLLIGLVTYRNTNLLTETSDAKDLSREVLASMDQAVSALKDYMLSARVYVITGNAKHLQSQAASLIEIDEALASLTKLVVEPGQKTKLKPIEPLVRETLDLFKSMSEVRQKEGYDAAAALANTDKPAAAMERVRQAIGVFIEGENALLSARSTATTQSTETARQFLVFGIPLSFAVVAMVGFFITRNIVEPLGQMTKAAERIAAGELSVQLTVNERGDEVGLLRTAFDRMTQSLQAMAGAAAQIAAGDLRATIKTPSPDDVLGNAFVRMIENLREQTRQLSEGASVLSSSAGQIVSSSAQLASSASQSAAAVGETTTTVEEVRQTAQLASEKSKGVATIAQTAAQFSQSGRKSIDDVVSGMTQIRQQMEAIAASMVRLSEQSQTIGQIIAAVDDLAAQSNLLAVNAAIEAAKAGEHGKGFSVVAQEVKSLAEQSRQATNQVRAILGDIQKATTAAVMATEQGNRAVANGERQTAAAGEAIQALAGSITESAQAATQIAASSQQQLVGVDQVATAMESIRQASGQNVAGARQLEVAARNLNDLGSRLKTMVEKYKL